VTTRAKPPSKTDPVPKPEDGVWDWTRCYFGPGERVTVHARAWPRLTRDAPGAVVAAKANRFGRVNYDVRTDRGELLRGVPLECLLRECRWPGSGSRLHGGL
jgi:hypothetical protein